MKKRLLFVLPVLMLLMGVVLKTLPANANEPDGQDISGVETVPFPQAGQVVNGFEALEIREFPSTNASVVRFVHQKTEAALYYIANDDIDRVFDLTFLTEAPDDTGNPVDNVILPIVEYDALSIEPWGYLDFIDSLFEIDKWNEQGLYTKAISKWLIGKQSTALVTTWPEAGMREILDAELAEKLAGIKAEMAEEEIAEIVARSTADYEYEDTSDMVASLQAVTIESLPEEWTLYDVHDETVEDGVRHIDVVANTEGIGTVELFFDISGFDQEDIHWLNLYAYLFASLETESHSKGELATLGRRYLHNSGITVTSYQDGKDGFRPWFEISWTTLDDDMDESYDLIRELLFEARFNDADQILELIGAIQASCRYNIPDTIETIMIDRAFARDSQRIRYNSYVDGLEYYDFLVRTEKQLQDNPGTVTAKLKSIQDALNNRTNAVVIFAGNERSIDLNRSQADKFLASLNARDIEQVKYDLPVPEKTEALIINSSVQYNMLNVSYKAMGLDDYEGWMTVAAHLVNDFYLTPLLRNRYGVYDPYCGNKNTSDGGIFIFSYQDPNIAETFEMINGLPEMLSEEVVDQEILNGYILDSYSYFAKPKGVLSGAISAAESILQKIPQDETLTWMRQLKQCTPEKLAEWAEMLKILIEEGAVRTAGGAAVINAEAGRYETILDPFSAGNRN